MATAITETPQKVPGRYMNTPAMNRTSSTTSMVNSPPTFRLQGQSQSQSMELQQHRSSQGGSQVSYPNLGTGAVQQQPQQPQQQPQPTRNIPLIERAARTINDRLDEESRFPALDSYLSQGYSSDYDVPPAQTWAPFQHVKTYNIPDEVFEQYNRAQVTTIMGLFADINHAWISIDNALYLWDYTNPSPSLLGYEEAVNSITAVKMAKPRFGVFVPAITDLLVVATGSDIHLIGMSCTETSPNAPTNVSLYQTKMQVPIRGINVQCIATSAKSGRIFFGGRNDNEIHEVTYQQEEKWFQNRCAKICHTRKGYESFIPSISAFSKREAHEYVVQMVMDDTRNTLYTLSNLSGIRAFHLRNATELNLSISRTFQAILNDISHKIPTTDLITRSTTIISITPIPAQEASRINLVATTSTGCRIFFSGVSGGYYSADTSGGYYSADTSGGLTSMQVHHVKFPPPELGGGPTATNAITAAPNGSYAGQQQLHSSRSLDMTRLSHRFPPGYFLCFVQKSPQAASDTVFISAPDSGRIAHPQEPSQANKLPEFGMWFGLEGRVEDVGFVTEPFGASPNPVGFGNELAVQFDKPVSEFAVLTNSGVLTYRRRRMVDVFAASIRHGGGEDGLEGQVRKFAHLYGRGETVATALAVACGQASDVAVDSRVTRITDSDILEYARRVFIEQGGRPEIDQNVIPASGVPSIDQVRPSPRHEGLTLYISRLLRSVWKAQIAVESASPAGAFMVKPTIPQSKLHGIQRDLVRLQEFLNTNKTFIEGLAGPEALGRVSTKQEEVALQAEHRALSSIVKLVADVIEGIAFVLVLFSPEERVEEIVIMLPDQSRQQLRSTTYEGLFCTDQGKELAKELVKSIVNRNIRAGSNVDTVTDALRRRCGSFCSADDCVIFKAQEALKKASEPTASSDHSRVQLNESLRLLKQVAASLTMDQLQQVVEQYNSLQFYAGAVQLSLSVAQECDRGNAALTWFNEGMPGQDSRAVLFDARQKCYDLIHQVVNAVDQTASQVPQQIDGQYTLAAKRKQEAYDVINTSQDELFQINLYDWYLSQGWSDRLLDVESPFVVSYLRRKSSDNIDHADLLWRYYAHHHSYVEAAKVQLYLAKSPFSLSLERRIEYLSFARANASTKTIGLTDIGRTRQSRHEMLREVNDLLDIANIQADILQRIRGDVRLQGAPRAKAIEDLDGAIHTLSTLFNTYADSASYHDITLLIYALADHRNTTDIRTAWQNLIESLHLQATEAASSSNEDNSSTQRSPSTTPSTNPDPSSNTDKNNNNSNTDAPLPYELLTTHILPLARTLHLSPILFPIPTLVPLLTRYAFEYQRHTAPPHWAPSLFLELGVPHDQLVSAYEALYYAQEAPFVGRNRAVVAGDLVFVVGEWVESTGRGVGAGGAGGVCGGTDVAMGVLGLVEMIAEEFRGDRSVRELAVAVAMRLKLFLR